MIYEKYVIRCKAIITINNGKKQSSRKTDGRSTKVISPVIVIVQ